MLEPPLASRDVTGRWCDVLLSADPSRLPELLANSVTDAHRNTLRYSSDYIQKMLREPHDLGKLSYYTKLVGDGWKPRPLA